MTTKFHRGQSFPMFFLVLCAEADTHSNHLPKSDYMHYGEIRLYNVISHSSKSSIPTSWKVKKYKRTVTDLKRQEKWKLFVIHDSEHNQEGESFVHVCAVYSCVWCLWDGACQLWVSGQALMLRCLPQWLLWLLFFTFDKLSLNPELAIWTEMVIL